MDADRPHEPAEEEVPPAPTTPFSAADLVKRFDPDQPLASPSAMATAAPASAFAPATQNEEAKEADTTDGMGPSSPSMATDGVGLLGPSADVTDITLEYGRKSSIVPPRTPEMGAMSKRVSDLQVADMPLESMHRRVPTRARRASILDSASPASRTISMRHGRFQPPSPVVYIDGKPKHVKPFASNEIRSTRYTWWNFVPKNLILQMLRPANAYFIAIAILQVIPPISISGGKPTILLPLVFVLVVSAIKDGVEDWKRHVADREENQRIYLRLEHDATQSTAKFTPVACKNIQVGDILRIEDEQSFPADLYLLYSSLEQRGIERASIGESKRHSMKRASSITHVSADILSKIPSTNPAMYGGSYAYVETANLDGESNLKVKLVTEFTRDLCDEPTLVAGGHFELRIEQPNGKLDKHGGLVRRDVLGIGGQVEVDSAMQMEQVLTLDNLLLRGSRLRNTGFIYGLVLYSGEESKIRMNSHARSKAPVKRSSIEALMNRCIYVQLVLQCVFCFVGGVIAGVWQQQHASHTYLFVFAHPALVGLQRFFTWLIIFSGFIPISLLVSLEVVKFAQGMFMEWDIAMCHWIEGDDTTNQEKQQQRMNKRRHSANTNKPVGGLKATTDSPSIGPSRAKHSHLGLSSPPMLRSPSIGSMRSGLTSSGLASSSSFSGHPPAGGVDDSEAIPGELQFARAQTSGLNEQLGLVGFVLSDKTGTLTENRMDFRKAFIGRLQYGTGTTDMMAAVAAAAASSRDQAAIDAEKMSSWEDTLESVAGAKTTTGNIAAQFGLPRTTPHVNFNARDQVLLSLQGVPPTSTAPTDPTQLAWQQQRVHEYFLNLALCNAVFPTVDEKEKIVYKAGSPDEEALVELARHCGYQLLERSPPFVTLTLSGPAAAYSSSGGHARATGSSGPSAPSGSLPAHTPVETLEFEQLALLDFSSKRKRMSVILRDADGQIHVYCKGADVTVLLLLSRAHGGDSARVPDWAQTSEALTRFSDEGLRTLVVCSATLPASWWDDPTHGWGTRYVRRMKEVAVEGPNEEGHFKGACKPACRRCALEEEIELSAQLNLVGGTAIEDKLQQQVPATIKALLDAGIKVWVLTGDKLETSKLIGLACNLLESAMERSNNLLCIEGDTLSQVTREVDKAYERVRALVARETGGTNRDIDEGDPPAFDPKRPRPILSPPPTKLTTPVGLLLESHAYALIMSSVAPGERLSPLVRKFLYVSTHCKSVVACRCQPSTKSSIVQLIKETQGVTTLAIGDGANDEPMITAASIGVGIRGVEGTSAVQASDYAISQFWFLRRLLFVHGHLSLRRVSILIEYIFYKTSLMCFCIFWNGISSGFSGQNIVAEWAYQLYNIVFTSLPILVFAVFDRDIAPEVLEQHPDIYRRSSSPEGAWFTKRIFWGQWMALSFVHSLIIYFFPYALYQSTSVESFGKSQGVFEMGVLVYTAVVCVTNLRLALLYRSWTWMHSFATLGSIGAYFACMLILNLSSVFGTAGADYFGSVQRLLRMPSFWATLFITIVTALWFDITLEAIGRFRENREQAQRYAHLRRQVRRQTTRSALAALAMSKRQPRADVEPKQYANPMHGQGEIDRTVGVAAPTLTPEQKEIERIQRIQANSTDPEVDDLLILPLHPVPPKSLVGEKIVLQPQRAITIPRFQAATPAPSSGGNITARGGSNSVPTEQKEVELTQIASPSASGDSQPAPLLPPYQPTALSTTLASFHSDLSLLTSFPPAIAPQHERMKPLVRTAPVLVASAIALASPSKASGEKSFLDSFFPAPTTAAAASAVPMGVIPDVRPPAPPSDDGTDSGSPSPPSSNSPSLAPLAAYQPYSPLFSSHPSQLSASQPGKAMDFLRQSGKDGIGGVLAKQGSAPSVVATTPTVATPADPSESESEVAPAPSPRAASAVATSTRRPSFRLQQSIHRRPLGPQITAIDTQSLAPAIDQPTTPTEEQFEPKEAQAQAESKVN